MAAVAAGSLVLFSLLAQQAALSRRSGDVLAPLGPQRGGGSTVTLPAPQVAPLADTNPGAAGAVITILDTAGPAGTGLAAQLERIRNQDPDPRPDGFLAALSLRMPTTTTLDFQGSQLGVSPRQIVPGPKTPDPPAIDDCPSGPDKSRAPGEHPHGGPPACGNPHGGPPGYDADRSRGPKADKARGPKDGSGGSDGGGPDGAGAPSYAPPGQEDRPASGNENGSGPSSPGRSGAAPNPGSGAPSGGSDHPHGAPPGQSKDASTSAQPSAPPEHAEDGNSGGSSGHPHGGPPGQTKKKG